jgi:hypothetical protein
MTQDEIIEMAIQAHYESKTWIDIYKDEITAGTVRGYLEAFAKLVAAKEREACIEIAEKQLYAMYISLTSHPPQNGTAVGIANQIRARGQEEEKTV